MALSLKSFVTRDATYSVASQILVSGLNFAVGITAARVLGITDFGLFSLILLTAAFTSNLEEQILCQPMMTLTGARARRSTGYFGAVLSLGVSAAMISALVVMAVTALYLIAKGQAPDPRLCMAAGAFTLCQNIHSTLRRTLFARQRVARAALIDGIRLLLVAGLVGFLVFSERTIDVATAFGVLALATGLAVAPFLIAGLRDSIRPGLRKRVLLRHWPISSWLVLTLLVAIGQEQALWIIAGIQFGDDAVGGLRAGQTLLGVTHLLVFALENFMPRRAAEARRLSRTDGLVRYLTAQSLFVGLVSMVPILTIAVFAEPLLAFVFGADFAAYGDLTRIFAAIYAVTVLRSIWIYYLRVVERTRDAFFSYCISSSLALVLVMPMTAWFGVSGIALTMLIAQTTLFGMVLAFVARHVVAERGAAPVAETRLGQAH
ncbi:MAG: lipopolysaccharide biosynthesis protein [Pseudomonadota bacterium]